MNFSTSNMTSYRHNMELVVSQAAIHLHNSLGPISTALFDRHGALVFNNNVLRYVNDSMLAGLFAACQADRLAGGPGSAQCSTDDGMTVCSMALDTQHLFVVVGRGLEAKAVEGFV